RALAERFDDGSAFLGGEAVGLEKLHDLHRLQLGLLLDLELLALALVRVMLDVALARQIAAEPHRDRAGGDLGEAGGDNEGGRIDGAGESRGQRKGNRQAVREPDDGVSHDEAGGEVLLDVRRGRHGPSPATLSRQAAGPRYRASGRSSR